MLAIKTVLIISISTIVKKSELRRYREVMGVLIDNSQSLICKLMECYKNVSALTGRRCTAKIIFKVMLNTVSYKILPMKTT